MSFILCGGRGAGVKSFTGGLEIKRLQRKILAEWGESSRRMNAIAHCPRLQIGRSGGFQPALRVRVTEAVNKDRTVVQRRETVSRSETGAPGAVRGCAPNESSHLTRLGWHGSVSDSIWARFMWKDLPAHPKSQRRIIGVWLIALVIGLPLFPGISLCFYFLFGFGLVVLTCVIPLGLLGLFFWGMWYLIRMTSRSQTTPSMSSDVGWSLFGSCGFLCAVIETLIFFAPGGDGGGGLGYWIFGIFFGLQYLLACLGFIQIVVGMPFTRIPRNWNRLGAVRRISLVTIVIGTACVAILCVYYLVELNVTCTNAVQPPD